jgi:hypothetical protein
MSPESSTLVEAYTKLLNPLSKHTHAHALRYRSQAEIEENVKRLRRLILVDGIPSKHVGCFLFRFPVV